MARETDEELVHRGLVNAERMVRAGVTTIFECGARNSTGFGVQRAIEDASASGRTLASGRPVTRKTGPLQLAERRSRGHQGVRSAIRNLIEEEGAGGIKMMATGGGMTTGTDTRFAAFSVEVLAAAADETHRHDQIITTHAHGVPGIRNATLAGIDRIQHTTMMGEDWTWAFDKEVAQQKVERHRGLPHDRAPGIRVQLEYEGGHQQPEPEPRQGDHQERLANGERCGRPA